MDVDLDDAGVGRDLQDLQPHVARRQIAFETHRDAARLRALLDGDEQFEIALDIGDRRHEDAQTAVFHLDAECRAHDPFRRGARGDERRIDVRAWGARRIGHRIRDAQLQFGERRQRFAQVGRVARDQVRIVGGRYPRQRVERQPIAHRRFAGDQEEAVAAHRPPARDPSGLDRVVVADRVGQVLEAGERQHETGRLRHRMDRDVAVGLLRRTGLRLAVGCARRILDVQRPAVALPVLLEVVLERGQREVRGDPERRGDRGDEARRVVGGPGLLRALRTRIRPRVISDEVVVEDQRVRHAGLPVHAPHRRQRPARQRLARIPLALAEMHESVGAVALHQRRQQAHRVGALGGAERIGVPLAGIAIGDGDEGRLAALREADVHRVQRLIDGLAETIDRGPLRWCVRQRHARRLEGPRDVHRVLEFDLAAADEPGDRCRAAGFRRRRERDVALPGQQARRRIETDPAGAGKIDLAPRVQVGEIAVGPGWSVERLHVGPKLDQVARYETRGEAEVAKGLHHQPSGVAARAGRRKQGLFGRLHAGFHADQIAHVLLQALVEPDEEVDRPFLRAAARRHALDEPGEQRRRLFLHEIRRELARQRVVVAERKVLGRVLEEEVERVVDRHLRDEVHRHAKVIGQVGEDEPGEIVRERILLPVDEVLGRRDRQRIRQDRRAAVRRRTQPDHLRTERDQSVVAVVGDMRQRNVDGQRRLR